MAWVMPGLKARKRTVAIGTGIAVTAMLASAPVWAVDVINRDKVPREIVVNSSDGDSSVRTLKPQEKVANVCTSCVVLTGNTSVEASGNDTVMVEGGKVSIASK